MIAKRHLFASTLVGALVFIGAAQVLAGGHDVVASQDDKSITMSNGIVALEVSRASGQVTSIKYTTGGKTYPIASAPDAMYWDANAELLDPPADAGQAPKKGYFRGRNSCELVSSTPQRAEIVVKAGPSKWFAFAVDYHWILPADTSGYYSYVVVHHSKDQPATKLWQTRFVHKVNLDLFDTWVVGDDQISPIPKSAVTKQLMDATFQLEDGTVKTKYANSVYWGQTPVYGIVGKEVGIWSVGAASEYYNGGPVKQGQTVHDNVLLRLLQSSHFGASGVDVAAGQQWDKIYGPFMTYFNAGPSVEAMWSDVKSRQQEEAGKWPYAWVDDPAYHKERGSVSGQWKLSTGNATQGAWVILAGPGGDWTAQGAGYVFWTRTGPDGKFNINKVIPGTYTLYVVGADQPEQFHRDHIEIVADKNTDVGRLEWTPVTHGKTLWQLGVFDRTAAEFRNGDDPRHFEMFRRYPEQFPDDVTFTIGKSDPRKDWNYAQWTWFCKKPLWTIKFNVASDALASKSKATLTIGVASAQPLEGKLTDVRVCMNGTEIGAIRLPKTGTAGYRGSAQDSPYNVVTLTFDASLLRNSENQLTLAHANARPFPDPKETVDFKVGQVMYDAIRLEVE